MYSLGTLSVISCPDRLSQRFSAQKVSYPSLPPTPPQGQLAVSGSVDGSSRVCHLYQGAEARDTAEHTAVLRR